MRRRRDGNTIYGRQANSRPAHVVKEAKISNDIESGLIRQKMIKNALLPKSSKPRFSGHNTFPPRFYWFYKAFHALKDGAGVDAFNADKGAIKSLGVGKNMLQAVTYWSEAAGLLESEHGRSVNSFLASRIFKDNPPIGDAFCERPTTIWIMQAHLAGSRRFAAPFWLFNINYESDFTAESAIEASLEYWTKEGFKVTPETVKRDITTYLNTYAPKHKGNMLIEEGLETPFAGLGLIKRVAGTDRYQMRRERRRGLDARAVAYALLNFWEMQGVADSTLSFNKSLFAPGSPGNVYRLDNASLESYAEEIEKLSGRKLVLDTSSGGSMDWRLKGSCQLGVLRKQILTK